VFLNVNNFYDPLLALVERGVSEGFITSAGRALITLVSEADASSAGSWGAAAILAAEKLGPEIQAAGSGYWNWSASQNGAKQPADVTQLASAERAVDVKDLTFAFTQEREPALVDCNLSLSRGSRCLLIGANGAGKSTLLRLLAGKRLPGRDAHVRVYGKDVFHDAPRGIVYLGTEWAMNPVVRGDIRVSHFLDSVGGFRHKARRDRLLDILDVDISWRMHQISDGERRRVQLTMGLMEEWDVLLLDEVTVDLDVQVRADLLKFLRSETEERGATIICESLDWHGIIARLTLPSRRDAHLRRPLLVPDAHSAHANGPHHLVHAHHLASARRRRLSRCAARAGRERQRCRCALRGRARHTAADGAGVAACGSRAAHQDGERERQCQARREGGTGRYRQRDGERESRGALLRMC
jgi:ABC-type Mn2+/Zn2+ transport system ATPase subunit